MVKRQRHREHKPERKTEESNESSQATFFAPLADMKYADQLKLKDKLSKKLIEDVTIGLKESASKRRYPVPTFAPHIEHIAALPETPDMGHRNKCEFTFGLNASGEKDVGFVKRVTGSVFVVEPISEDNLLVASEMRKLVSSIKDAIIPSFEPYDRSTHETGILRSLLVRMGAKKDFGLVFQVKDRRTDSHVKRQKVANDHSPFSKDSSSFLTDSSVDALTSALRSWADSYRSILNISSISLQFNDGLSDACTTKPELIWGDHEEVEMSVCGLKFSVHPLSFFQTNTKACEMLYNIVADWALPDRQQSSSSSVKKEKMLILDLCCGVGTIGQCVAARAMKSSEQEISIVGIDIVEAAIEDAKKNAARNFPQGVNLRFEAGRAEHVLPKLLKELNISGSEQVVAIVDPPRSGLHATVLKALRDNDQIDSVVYVSCNPDTLAKDCVLLCESLTDCPEEEGVAVSKPFKPTRLMPVDMFPNTNHCEMIIKLQR